MMFLSRRVTTAVVIWPLNLSIIASAALAGTFSKSLVAYTYGITGVGTGGPEAGIAPSPTFFRSWYAIHHDKYIPSKYHAYGVSLTHSYLFSLSHAQHCKSSCPAWTHSVIGPRPWFNHTPQRDNGCRVDSDSEQSPGWMYF